MQNYLLSNRGSKTIILPIDMRSYAEVLHNRFEFRKYIDDLISCFPELFPTAIQQGYRFYGWSKTSQKQALPRRRIQLLSNQAEYLLHPCFMFPYLRASTSFVAEGLFLRRYNVPYHAVVTLLGKDAMFWYRAECFWA